MQDARRERVWRIYARNRIRQAAIKENDALLRFVSLNGIADTMIKRV